MSVMRNAWPSIFLVGAPCAEPATGSSQNLSQAQLNEAELYKYEYHSGT